MSFVCLNYFPHVFYKDMQLLQNKQYKQLFLPPSLLSDKQKQWHDSFSYNTIAHHPLSLVIFITPSTCLPFPVICAPLPQHHMFLFLLLEPLSPLPACLHWYSLLSLPLSMYFALIRSEHRQTVLTIWAPRGCCRGRETATEGWGGRMEKKRWRRMRWGVGHVNDSPER